MMSKSALIALSLAAAVVVHAQPASASDNDFATLDERVAELETASLRAGGRKLTMHIYGQVNQAVMFWDDGFKSGTRVIDNDTSSSRFGIMGQTTSRSSPTFGYRFEFEVDPSFRSAGSAPGAPRGRRAPAAAPPRHRGSGGRRS